MDELRLRLAIRSLGAAVILSREDGEGSQNAHPETLRRLCGSG
jgi:hypothetical protein